MPVDYDDRLHRVYAEGRKLSTEGLQRWIAEYERHAPQRRPLTVLDLGSGTGRFTPALADAFGGPVYGVEPSSRMRAVAEQDATHSKVIYREGSADKIPLPDESCDLALLFLSFHHFPDQPRALRELARVMKAGSVVLLRTQFSDRMPDLYWYRYFASARRVDAAMYRTLDEVRTMATDAGLVPDDDVAGLPAQGARTLREVYERVSMRALSTFEHLPPDEVERGFEAFARDAEQDPDRALPEFRSDLLVLRRPA